MVSLCFIASFHLSKSHQQDSHFDSSFSKGIDTPPRTTLEPKNWSVGRCFSFSKIEGIFTFQPLFFWVVVSFFKEFSPRQIGEMIQIWWASCFNRRIDWHWGNDPNSLVTRRLFPLESLLSPGLMWVQRHGARKKKHGAVDVVLTVDVLRSPDGCGCFFC